MPKGRARPTLSPLDMQQRKTRSRKSVLLSDTGYTQSHNKVNELMDNIPKERATEIKTSAVKCLSDIVIHKHLVSLTVLI